MFVYNSHCTITKIIYFFFVSSITQKDSIKKVFVLNYEIQRKRVVSVCRFVEFQSKFNICRFFSFRQFNKLFPWCLLVAFKFLSCNSTAQFIYINILLHVMVFILQINLMSRKLKYLLSFVKTFNLKLCFEIASQCQCQWR